MEIFPEVKRMWDEVHPVMEEDQEYEIEIRSETLNEKYVGNVNAFFESFYF